MNKKVISDSDIENLTNYRFKLSSSPIKKIEKVEVFSDTDVLILKVLMKLLKYQRPIFLRMIKVRLQKQLKLNQFKKSNFSIRI